MEQLSIDIPESNKAQWNVILQLCERILDYPNLPTKPSLWPILGLSKKAATTTKAIGILASHRLWSDAIVLRRTLLEIEITIKWILLKDTETRIKQYISGIDQESLNLLKKMSAGKSVSAQMLNDLINPEELVPSSQCEETIRCWSGLTLRDMAIEVDLERIYDMCYWVSSAFTHSHALSILDCNLSLKEDKKILGSFFGMGLDDYPCFMVLSATPTQALNIFMATDEGLQIGLAKEIERAWKAVDQAIQQVMGGKFKFTVDQKLKPGDIEVRTNVNGNIIEKHYSPHRSSIKHKK